MSEKTCGCRVATPGEAERMMDAAGRRTGLQGLSYPNGPDCDATKWAGTTVLLVECTADEHTDPVTDADLVRWREPDGRAVAHRYIEDLLAEVDEVLGRVGVA